MPGNGVNPWQPSTSPWDQSFTAGGQRGAIVFPSAVPPNASPLVPILQHTTYNVVGTSVPPAQPSFWEATTIQLTMNGANGGTTFTDQRFGTTPAMVTNVTTQDAAYKFGGSSAYGDGTSGAATGILYNSSTLWDLAGNNFTIEGWFNTSQSQQDTILVTRSDSTFTSGSWSLLINTNSSSDGLLSWWAKEYSGASPLLTGTVSHRDGKWHHVAVVRVGNTWSLYVDGVQEVSAISATTIATGSQQLSFAGGHFFNRTLLGYLNMWRIVRGVAVYTGSHFAIPTSPFPTS